MKKWYRKVVILGIMALIIWMFAFYQAVVLWNSYQEYLKGVEMREKLEEIIKQKQSLNKGILI